ncbi:MAG: GAF domain-containing protein [Flavobacteriales bacterium]
MSEHLALPATTDRRTLYAALLPQVQALLENELDPIAAMANMSAALRQAFGWHWIGFYRVQNDELVVGPFQGPIACSPIGFGKGVCGRAWAEERAMIVRDVNDFPGHIACSAESASEIVLPLRDRTGVVVAVLDVDSARLDDFSQEDVLGLSELCAMIERVL